MRDNKHQNAFTLAEVLITLTILGIIAAITIPNLVNTWRKHARTAQLKEAYSLINQAVKLSIAENGPVNTWNNLNNNDNQRNLERDYLAPYLKVEKIYTFNGKKIWEVKNIRGNVDQTLYSGLLLQNGMRITSNGDTANGIIKLFVDVNGKQGPDTYGNDVFLFAIVIGDATVDSKWKNSAGQVTTWAGRPNPGYYTNSTFPDIVDRVKQYCCNSSNCSCCARLIMFNGWKIPDDYPITSF